MNLTHACGDPTCDGCCGYPPDEAQGGRYRRTAGYSFAGMMTAQPNNMSPYREELEDPGLGVLETVMSGILNRQQGGIGAAADSFPGGE